MNSHIIPEFTYAPLYDEKHRFNVLSTKKSKKNVQLQKGIRQKLLCADCETKLSRYERYVSQVFSGQIQTTIKRNGNHLRLEGLNYRMFKLFTLSILWRAGVAHLPFFSQVNLGLHEENLRTMIHDENPGSPKDYPCMMTLITDLGTVQTDLIIQPSRSRLDGHYSYRFVFGGIAWVYLVSNHKKPNLISQAILSKSGDTTMTINQASNMPFIVNFANELREKGKLS